MAIFPKNKKNKESRKEEREEIFVVNSVVLPLLPHMTEKAAKEEEGGKYAFRVRRNATRGQISEEFTSRFGIRPLKINIVQARSKSRRRGAFVGYTTGYKKAIITIPKDKKIDVVPK